MYNHLSLLNLLSLLQDFDRIVLDEAVLGVARMFREELVNYIIRVYGIKYKIFHEQVLINRLGMKPLYCPYRS
jgi:hypothetical protein